jgi:WD40 repeat protein
LSGEETYLLQQEYGGPVETAVFSPNGKFVLTINSKRIARIFEVSSGHEVFNVIHSEENKSNDSYSFDGECIGVFSPDGKSIVISINERILP